MEKDEIKGKEKQVYVEPEVIATYEKEELKETIKPEGNQIYIEFNEE
jgi:hypothetical protein